uniref:OBP26 n=1 Tax=Corythucha ciliata TaxID=369451 RepID=A0A3G2YUX9_CORCT|nr:OBP26 [Corythucha ciliata]
MFWKGCLLMLLAVAAVHAQQQEPEECRTPPPNWPKKPPQCCDVPFPLEGMKKQFGNCVKQNGGPTSAVPTAKALADARMCLEECVYKGAGLKKQKGLDSGTIGDEFRKTLGNKKEWTAPVDKAIKSCMGAVGKFKVDTQCDSIPLEFSHCVMRELFLNCPSKQWKNTAECNLVKGRMQICPNIPPPPPPAPQQPPPRRA